MRVFISYASGEQALVSSLAEDLETSGISTWFDPKLLGGSRWWETILSEIRKSDVVVFAVSSQSLDSDACRLELEYAVAVHRTLIPVRIKTVEQVSALPELRELQWVDYLNGAKSEVLRVIHSIHAAPRLPLPSPLPVEPPPPGDANSDVGRSVVTYISVLTVRTQVTADTRGGLPGDARVEGRQHAFQALGIAWSDQGTTWDQVRSVAAGARSADDTSTGDWTREVDDVVGAITERRIPPPIRSRISTDPAGRTYRVHVNEASFDAAGRLESVSLLLLDD